ncbi:MAG: DUF2294 family protein [Candidatus Omnitrophica bacterium]|nr:DUF2294 family protein [Candidatus Omnitrophota bacterium]
MKVTSKSAIEDSVNQAMNKFLREHLGERSAKVTTKIFADTIVIREREVLPPAERHMLRDKKGMVMIKELKKKLMERASPLLREIIEELTGAEVVDFHLDMDINTGERIEIFTLDQDIESPLAHKSAKIKKGDSEHGE